MLFRGGRPRFFKDARTAAYYKVGILLAQKFAPAEPISGPIRLKVEFFLPRPQKLKGQPLHIKRPDLDNLEKGLLDILTQAGFWNDDNQVYWKETAKCYVSPGAETKMVISIQGAN